MEENSTIKRAARATWLLHALEHGSNIWLYFARPVDMLLAYGDEMGIRAHCDDINTWISYWGAIEWLRELSQNEEERKRLFDGRLDFWLPLNIRLSGNLDMSPVLWLSSDATLRRVGVVNWRIEQFICAMLGSLFCPLMADATETVHIIDVELLGIVRGIAAWVKNFNWGALGISDNPDALHRVSSRKAKHGVALQLLRTVLRWLVNTNSDSSGIYARSHHNVSADHLTRLSFEEIGIRAKQNDFEWVDPYDINDNWKKFVSSVKIGTEWKAEDCERADRERAYWNPAYGSVLYWKPGALDVAKPCRGGNCPCGFPHQVIRY